MHPEARDAVKHLVGQGETLHIVPQNLYEFWVVCTRPTAVNGMGLGAAEAASELAQLKGLFPLLDDTPSIYGVWEDLVSTTPILGKNAHDARLVSAMLVHGIAHLLTFNAQDFRQYRGIVPVTPADVLAP